MELDHNFVKSVFLLLFLVTSFWPCRCREGEYEAGGVSSGLFLNNNNNNNNNNLNEESDSMCLNNFDVSEGRIIRTKDSQGLGGRFLNESDLSSVQGSKAREECLKLCCRTQHCNVMVLEEKNTWSCYLFDCGPSEDFRCKFTSQIHYMSAIMRRKIEPPILQPPIIPMLNKHETELTELRNPEMDKNADNIVQNSPNGALVGKRKPEEDEKSLNDPLGDILGGRSGRCNNRQFMCKSNGECIGVYNTCDGIPNCPDSSDESPMLCKEVGEMIQKSSAGKQSEDYGNRQSLPVDPPQSIFNHKTQGVIDDNFGVQPPHNHGNYWKNYDYNSNSPLYQPPLQQQIPQQSNSLFGGGNLNYPYIPQGPPQGSNQNQNPNQNNLAYIPLSSQQSQQQFFNNILSHNNNGNYPNYPNYNQMGQNSNNPSATGGINQPQQGLVPPLATTPVAVVPTITQPPVTTTTVKSDLAEVEKIIANMNLKKIPLQVDGLTGELVHDHEDHSANAGFGAVLVFILGILMSIIMTIIIGCRLKRFGTRGRRGKNRLNEDFLVDGMYL